MGTGCWREERTECDGVWEQGAGERRGQSVTVFAKRVLERGENRVWRCLGTWCWREERTECDGVWEQSAGEKRGQSLTVLERAFRYKNDVATGALRKLHDE